MSIPQIEQKPTGFQCWKCRKENLFNAYVYKEWNEEVDFKCECGAQFIVRRGGAMLVSSKP